MTNGWIASFFTSAILPLAVITGISLTYSNRYEDIIASYISDKHEEIREADNPSDDRLQTLGRRVFNAHLYLILFKKSYQTFIVSGGIWTLSYILYYLSKFNIVTLPSSPLGIGTVTATRGLAVIGVILSFSFAIPVLYSFGITDI